MILNEFAPDPALHDFVQCYRVLHFKFDPIRPAPVKIYPPKPENVLHFFLKDGFEIEGVTGKRQKTAPICFIGQRTHISHQFTAHEIRSFQIVFQPTAIYRIFGILGSELTNKCIDAKELFPKQIQFLYEQFEASVSTKEMIVHANRFLLPLVRNVKKEKHLIDDVSSLIMKTNGNLSLDFLAKEACLSTKQFKRKFNERTGVNPKIFGRINRFTKALNLKNAYPEMNWLRVAIECGHFDYQHLVKDYKDLTGYTPTGFLLNETKSPEKQLGLTEEVYKARIVPYKDLL